MVEGCREKLGRIKKSYVTNLELEESLSIHWNYLDVIVCDFLTFDGLFGVLFFEVFYNEMGVVPLEIMEDYP